MEWLVYARRLILISFTNEFEQSLKTIEEINFTLFLYGSVIPIECSEPRNAVTVLCQGCNGKGPRAGETALSKVDSEHV